MSRIPSLVYGDNYGPDVDSSRWVVIYPPYIDKLRKENEGRKIGKDKCVEKPTMKEVFECVQMLKLQTALELNKAYCRDYFARGRIRIKMFDDDGRPVRNDIPTRRILYAKVAELIPKHREQVNAKEGKLKAGNKVAAGAGSSSGGGGGNNNNKQPTGKGAPAPSKKKKKGKR